MSKQDRQGVRTPAELERKYNFGNDQKTVSEMKRTLASYGKELSELRQLVTGMIKGIEEMNKQLEEMVREFVLASIVGTDAGWELYETDYAALKGAFDNGKAVTVYIDHDDGCRRYYYAMGTSVYNGVDGLLFQYGFGNTVRFVFVGADESVTVEDVTLVEA